MARVLVSEEEAEAGGVVSGWQRQGSGMGWRRTVVKHGMRDLVSDVCGRVDGVGRPLLHGGAVDGGFIMLEEEVLV